MRSFNVTGLCVPSKHYMVDIRKKIDKIIKLIDNGYYFTINRARQYGKTTTLSQLRRIIANDYICAYISFEGVGDEHFEESSAFCSMFLRKVSHALAFSSAPKEYAKEWLNESASNFVLLSGHITRMCEDKKVVLLIDEIDKSGNNRIMLHFLGMLRDKYLSRQDDMDYTFQSVVLAGVTDIKNIKLKMINDGVYEPTAAEGKIYNSPWNIAADFNVDMSFSPAEITSMLSEYESEHYTGMDIMSVSEEIYLYTSGYPFLVSRICLCIENDLDRNWTKKGVQEAVKVILHERNTLFDDLIKNLMNYRNLYKFLYSILIVGERKSFMLYDDDVMLASTFGYVKSDIESRKVIISNKIFEILMSDYFASRDINASRIESKISGVLYQDVVKDGVFDMELCLRKFAEHYTEIFADEDIPFLERHGRLLFLSYIKPLVNGLGFYHIESQYTDQRRMDIIVDFGREQFIIELKLWKGESKHQEAYEQLAGYMENKNASSGFLLTFDFRKETNKQPKAEWIDYKGLRIFDVIV